MANDVGSGLGELILKINQKQIICWSIVMLLSSVAPVLKAESLQDQVLRLEATIRTLTVQNAELIKENDNLRKQMANAISAKREGKLVVAGCDVKSISKQVTFESDRLRAAEILENWLKREGANCTDQQLRQISGNLNTWIRSEVFGDHSQAIIRFLLKDR